MKQKRVIDMTQGNAAKLILTFALPLILTNLGQQFYAIVDAAIIGRGIGTKALAAVGSTDWSYWLVLWTVSALTQGFATFVARYFGKKDIPKMNQVVAASFILCFIIGTLLTAAGVIVARPLLQLLNTPTDILEQAVQYLTFMVAGTLIVTTYNMTSAILRALGDGKTPLTAMLIATVMNIGLDSLFVLVFHWGIAGAAVATLMSQATASFYNFIQIRRTEYLRLGKETWRFDKDIYVALLRFGLPLAVQHIVIALGGMILQSSVNLQGSTFGAGYAANNKLIGLLESTAISLNFAFTTFMSQNFGAGKADRIREGLKTAVCICIGTALSIAAVMFLFGDAVVTIFMDAKETGAAESIMVAKRYLHTMSACLVFLYLLYAFRSTLEAMGNSFWSMMSGTIEFVARVSVGKLFLGWLGNEILYFAEPIAWIASTITLVIPCIARVKKFAEKKAKSSFDGTKILHSGEPL